MGEKWRHFKIFFSYFYIIESEKNLATLSNRYRIYITSNIHGKFNLKYILCI